MPGARLFVYCVYPRRVVCLPPTVFAGSPYYDGPLLDMISGSHLVQVSNLLESSSTLLAGLVYWLYLLVQHVRGLACCLQRQQPNVTVHWAAWQPKLRRGWRRRACVVGSSRLLPSPAADPLASGGPPSQTQASGVLGWSWPIVAWHSAVCLSWQPGTRVCRPSKKDPSNVTRVHVRA